MGLGHIYPRSSCESEWGPVLPRTTLWLEPVFQDTQPDPGATTTTTGHYGTPHPIPTPTTTQDDQTCFKGKQWLARAWYTVGAHALHGLIHP